MSVVEAVERELERIKGLDERLSESPLAMMAVELARQLDGENSATSKSLCVKALKECLDALEARAPAERAKDGIDELKSRREEKPARRARAQG